MNDHNTGTITDQSGRTLSGQTTEAFYTSVRHSKPLCVGLNCALGAPQMLPFLQRLAKVAECFVHAYPNAGLPNAMGEYDCTPEQMAKDIGVFASLGLLNFAGGLSQKHFNFTSVKTINYYYSYNKTKTYLLSASLSLNSASCSEDSSEEAPASPPPA